MFIIIHLQKLNDCKYQSKKHKPFKQLISWHHKLNSNPYLDDTNIYSVKPDALSISSSLTIPINICDLKYIHINDSCWIYDPITRITTTSCCTKYVIHWSTNNHKSTGTRHIVHELTQKNPCGINITYTTHWLLSERQFIHSRQLDSHIFFLLFL